MNKLKYFILFIFCISCILSCSNNTSNTSDLMKIKFMAGYKPQANLPFVAAYVANEKGYFKDEGLDVEILHSTGSHLKLLLAGEVDITTAAASSVIKRRTNSDVPISSIMLFGQTGQQAFISLEDKNIQTVSDWQGKIFGYKISLPPEYLAMININNLDRNKIEEVKVGFDPRILTEGKVDILSIYKSNEPNLIKKLGYDVKIWDPAEFGVPTLGLTYITLEDTINQRPDMLQRFNRATLRAIEFILENSDETIEIVMLYATNSDKEHQRFMLEKEIEQSNSISVKQNGFGWSEKEKWDSLQDFLFKYKSIDSISDSNLFFTNQFLGKNLKNNKSILERIGLSRDS
ncbi:MAG: ABC transporter substrate-binding protein [SAR202 cluster bacterium]|nr:ABC transporter substrate-binding protein [SAR202 cluster bacterium]